MTARPPTSTRTVTLFAFTTLLRARDRPFEPAARLGAVRDDLERDHVELQHVLVELLVELAALALLHPCKMAHLVETGAGAAHGGAEQARGGMFARPVMGPGKAHIAEAPADRGGYPMRPDPHDGRQDLDFQGRRRQEIGG